MFLLATNKYSGFLYNMTWNNVKVTVLWDVMPCILLDRYQRVGGMRYTNLQDRWENIKSDMERMKVTETAHCIMSDTYPSLFVGEPRNWRGDADKAHYIQEPQDAQAAGQESHYSWRYHSDAFQRTEYVQAE